MFSRIMGYVEKRIEGYADKLPHKQKADFLWDCIADKGGLHTLKESILEGTEIFATKKGLEKIKRRHNEMAEWYG
ncbi:MAG: hypothetical protein Q8N88_02915, partial [Nanoarchaeota archaeon]|nr:hypothetical protein [Nanoarchaeota archaeon]